MIKYFTRHPTAANLLMGVFLVMGAFTLPELQRETFPRFTPDQVTVSVPYPGASAEDVEKSICQRIEEVLDGVEYVKEMTSVATEGSGRVTLEMDEDGDLQEFTDDIRNEVDSITDFPDLAEEPIVAAVSRTDRVISLAVTGPMSDTDLKEFCEDIKEELQDLPEVTLVDVGGFSDRQIRIEVSQEELLKYGLSASDIASAVTQQSVDLPAGTTETSDREVMLRFVEERSTVQEYEDLVVVSGTTGAELRLGDIATITDQFEDEDTKVIFNGRRAGILSISKNENQDTLVVADAVNAYIEKKRLELPEGVSIETTMNFASIVRDRLSLLTGNGIQGLVLVFLSMLFFFSFRLSFWVTAGLPVSFMGAFFLMHFFGYTVNMMTMVALLMSLGMLMDDAIVISENIASHIQRGESAYAAAINGTREVAVGVISSFLTTAGVFLPLTFIDGRLGKVMRVIPVVLLFVLAASLVEAFLILPHHLAHALKGKEKQKRNRIRQFTDFAFEWFRQNVFGRIVDCATRYRYITVALVLFILTASFGMYTSGKLKFQSFPSIDGDQLQAAVLFPQGTPARETEKAIRQITEALEKANKKFTPDQPDGKALVKNIYINMGTNSSEGESGAHAATVNADLLEAEYRATNLDEVIAVWRKETGVIAGAISSTFSRPTRGPQGGSIEVRLSGKKLDRIKAAAKKVKDWYSEFAGVSDIRDDLRAGKPELLLKMRPGASSLGLRSRTIGSQLRTAVQGSTALEIQVGREEYEVDIRLKEDSRNSIGAIESLRINSGLGAVPLENVVTSDMGQGFSTITRIDGRRTVTVEGDVQRGVVNVAELNALLQKEFMPEFEKEFPDIKLEMAGEAKRSAETSSSMGYAFLTGVIVIFMLLSFQFRSYLEPIMVMIAIPCAMIGVIWGHVFMGISVSLPSLMGFIALSGVVVNDSILLVEFIKIHRAQGMGMMDAVRQASRQRFRPIMLTSLTTIVGLVPLLSEKSFQAQMLIPLATSTVFGLLASTVLILIVIPCLYGILHDFGLTRCSREEGAEVNNGKGKDGNKSKVLYPEFTKAESSDDVETVAGLASEIWTEHFTPIIGPEQVRYMLDKFQSASAMQEQIKEGMEYYLISVEEDFAAEESGQTEAKSGSSLPVVVGYFAIKPEKKDGKMFLSKLYLRLDYRGCGVGRKAIEFIETLCREENLPLLHLTVNRNNQDTIIAYERIGFHKSGEQVADIGGGFVMDDYLMEKEVMPVEY